MKWIKKQIDSNPIHVFLFCANIFFGLLMVVTVIMIQNSNNPVPGYAAIYVLVVYAVIMILVDWITPKLFRYYYPEEFRSVLNKKEKN